MSTIEQFMADGFQSSFGDTAIMGILVLAFFGVFVMLQNTRFDAKLEQRLAELRGELRQEIAALRTDLLRWMFGFWVTTILTLAGLLVGMRR